MYNGGMDNLYGSLTFRLFKKRGDPFLEGIASILDAPEPEQLYNYDDTPEEADRKSIQADWKQVGNDLRSAIHGHISRQQAK